MANNNNAGLGAINTSLFAGNNNNQPNNNYNNFNNDPLGDLMFQALMIIDGFEQTGRADYQDLSDIISDMGRSAAFDERAVNGSEELAIWNRLNEIRDQLAGAFHAQQRAAPVQMIVPPAPVVNRYSAIPNVGRRTLPKNAENVVSKNTIQQNTNMVNFHGESGYGRYYTRNTFNALPRNGQGFKSNPATRAQINSANVVSYKANIANEGGKRKYKKTRKVRKSRSTRKGRKANTRK